MRAPHAAQSPSPPADFYERAYATGADEGAEYSRWRALGAVGKAEHVIALCTHLGLRPASTLDVGCGDGALLSELRRRGFGGRLAGVEISSAAVALASTRAEIDEVSSFDGHRLERTADRTYELGVLSHVLEHVSDPAGLLQEVGRACGAVVVEVPLEANWSARRAGKRRHGVEIGHVQLLDRTAVRELVARAGLSLAAELEDPLPLRAHAFFARSPGARAKATLKWAVRAAVHRASSALARRAFTVHYACLCLPPAT